MHLFGIKSRILASVLVFGILTPTLPANAEARSDSAPALAERVATAKVIPKNTKAPAITGTARVPNRLSVTNGTWSGAPTSYTYQWFRCTAAVKKAATKPAASCSTIAAATASFYTLTDADTGKFILARVSGVNVSGTASIHTVSTGAVVAQFLAPANTVAPVVTGSAVSTSTLSASNGTWTESPTTFSYQWYRCTKAQRAASNALASGCSNIGGATAATYDLTSADVGKFVGVAVTAINVAGSTRKWSKSTAVVTAFPTPANTVAPAVTGTAQVSRILTLSNGTWNNRPTSYAYKWFACTATKPASATLPTGCTQIAGETDPTFQLLEGQQSRYVMGMVTATNISGFSVRYSATTAAVSVPSPYAPSALVQPIVDIDGESGDAISGRAMVGSVLVADEGTWLGYPIPEKRFSYWYRCASRTNQSSSSQPAGCYVIPDSEGDINHIVTLDDLGYYLLYEVIATNTQGVVRNYTPTTSAVTANPVPYVQPTISGDPSYESVLEISDGEWATPPSVDVELYYSWYRCSTETPVVLAGLPVGCEEIAGAQDSSYAVAKEDLGHYVFGVVTALNSYDELASAVAGTMGISDAAPKLMSNPTVSGTRVAGNALSVAEANYVAYPEPTVSVQWLRCTAAVTSATTTLPGTCAAITGETGPSYTLIDADLGRFITARTTITNNLGTLVTIAVSTVAVGSVPAFTVAPAVTGTTIIGSTLVVSAGTVTGTPTPTRAYQWLRCSAAIETVVSLVPETCTTIPSATGTSYVTTSGDAGKRISVRVIATNAVSSTTLVTLTSSEIEAPPTRLTAPVLSGTPTQGVELSVSDGTWSALPTPTVSYQWVRCSAAVPANTFVVPGNCVNISGATLSTYTANTDDLGKFVTAIVTATNTRGSASTLAPSVTAIASLPSTIETPVLTGTATRGSVLTATQIEWSGIPTPSVSLQWYRCVSVIDVAASVIPDGCVAISGATSTSYTIVEADAGKYLTFASVASNAAGTSRKIGLSTPVVQSIPSVVVAPTITGDRWLGSELAVEDGQWFEYPEATVTYQWYRCSSPVTAAATVPAHCSESITGATTSTYTLDGADAGKYLTAVVEHTNSLGTTRHIAAQTVATFLPPSIDAEPTLTGTAALGSTLTLDPGLWTGYPAPTTSSTWFACDTEIQIPTNQVPGDCSKIASGSNALPSIGVGWAHTCSVSQTGAVYCWGWNAYGQVGDGTLVSRATPTLVHDISDATQVTVGDDFTCVLISGGTVRCWGANLNGQLGDGTTTSRMDPVQVAGISDAVSISAAPSSAWDHVCAVLATGVIKCWGGNNAGQLGDGTKVSRLYPVTVSGIFDALSVSVGDDYSCALLSSGSIKCWGANSGGTLGDGSTIARLTPVAVSGISNATEISSRGGHACALLSTGDIRCWGNGTVGGLGNGSTTTRLTPTTVTGINNAVAIATGRNHTCAVLTTGEVRCWGHNYFGEIGDGTKTLRKSPVTVGGVTDAIQVAAGYTHTCAINAQSTLLCWGSNYDGRLGDGTEIDRLAPTSVLLRQPLVGGSRLSLRNEHVGKFITFSTVASNSGSETTWVSPSSSAVTAPPTPTTNPSTTGSRLVGQILTLSPGVFVEYPASDSATYKWYRCSVAIAASTTSSDSCYLISGASDLTYTQTADDAGYYISGAVTRTNSIASVTAWSAASSTTNQAPVNVIDGFIDGDPIAGTSLSASEGVWQGFPVPSLQFQWYRCSAAVASVVSTVPAGCATIAAATTSNYLLAPADMGHYITFAVTRANTLGSVTRVAQSTAVVTGVPVVVTAPAVSGSRVSGSVLTVSAGTWLAHPSATTTRQWYRCTSTVAVTETTPASCTAIEGETGLTYTQTLNDAGKYVTAATTQTNANGAKTVWAAGSLASNYPPIAVTEPSISGTSSYNSTLSVSTGEWLGFPTPTPTYQWYRCATEVASEASTVPVGCETIATSGSSATYTVVGPDMGKFLIVRVTQTNSVSAAVRFTRSTAVITGPPVAQLAPEIAGIRTLGQTLSVTDGTWWAFPSVSDTAYQWFRCSAALSTAIATIPGTCAEIEGENANRYVLTTDDSGTFITARVSHTNPIATSTMVAAQTTASTQFPTNTAEPSISGTINMGELLTASEGTWQGFPRPTYTYEWLECSSEVTTASSARPSGCSEFQSDAKVSAGTTHTCVAQADGTVYCWGASSGSFSTSIPSAQSGSDKVVQVASGNAFTCYVLVDSSVKCFGANGSGQIGDGTTTTRATPVVVSGLRGVRSIDAGDAFTCALMIDGTVKCWGNNASGQLGLGNTTNQSTPQTIPGLTNVISLDTGASHACAVISGGSVRCWGSGTSGQIGNGANINQSSPTAVSTITTAVSVSAGGSHTCAVLTTGGVRCWGLNTSGQLGNASLLSTLVPVGPLGLTTGASSVAAGSSHTCVTMSDGTAKCWGSNSSGQLGTGNTTSMNIPSTVSGLSGVANISAGGSHTCVVQRSGSVSCWGQNSSGQIGDGTTTSPRATATLRTFNLSKILLNEPEFGKRLVAAVSGMNSIGTATRYSTSTNLVASIPVLLVPPSLSTGSSVGATVTVTDGSWTASSPITEYEYQWYRCVTSVSSYQSSIPENCEEIANAITNSYVLASEDAGKHVLAWVKASANSGSTSVVTASNGLVTMAPKVVVAPTITGSTIVGSTVTASPGQWQGFPVPQIKKEWLICNTEIATAPATTPIGCDEIETGAAVLTSGNTHTCAITSGGSLWCWGSNNSGQLGDGTTTDRPNPAATIGLDDVVDVDGGGLYTCAVLRNGTINCWGTNNYGQLGDGTTTSRNTPSPVSGITNAVAVSASSHLQTCAVMADGTVKCWGFNGNYQLGDGTSTQRLTPVNVTGITNAVSVSAGDLRSCALLSTGTVKCWGYNGSGGLGDGTTSSRSTPVTVSGISNAIAVESGADHSCALLSTGAVKCWGANYQGALGDGTLTRRLSPVSVSGITSAVSISLGSLHSCATMADGSAKCWGNNDQGRLGDGTSTHRQLPVTVPGLSGVAEIAAGSNHTCAALVDGSVRCWGYNLAGQLGNGSKTDSLTPVLANHLSGYSQDTLEIPSSYLGKSLIVRWTASNSFGSTVYWSATTPFISAAPRLTTAPAVSGTREMGATLSVDSGVWVEYPAADVSYQWYRCDSAVPAYSTSNPAQCAAIAGETAQTYTQVDADTGKFVTAKSHRENTVGFVDVWSVTNSATNRPPLVLTTPTISGSNSLGSSLVLDGDTWRAHPNPNIYKSWYACDSGVGQPQTLPADCELVSSGSVSDLSTGGGHSCAVVDSGGIACWGDNQYGQLGIGSTVSQNSPNSVVGVTGAANVSAGAGFTCAVDKANRLYCWGSNEMGRLGDGTEVNRTTPVLVRDGGIVDVSVGWGHACAITSSATVLCWGHNEVGQLGLGNRVSKFTPTEVPGLSNVISISAGEVSTCAVLESGIVKCWGTNDSGNLGDGTKTERLSPVTTTGISNATQVSMAWRSTCALLSTGTVKCWGHNGEGRLGDGTEILRTVPADVSGISDALSVSVYDSHACALLSDGTAKCWGKNYDGALGNGSMVYSSIPVTATPGTKFTAVSAGRNHSCGVKVDGGLICWGTNQYGQLGDGTNSPSSSGTLVASGVISTSTLSITESLVGKYLLGSVRASNSVGESVQFTDFFGPVSGKPVLTSTISVSGNRSTTGQMVTASSPTFRAVPANTETTYQWYRCSSPVSTSQNLGSSGCQEIENATSQTYVLTSADEGRYVTAKFTAANSAGSASIWASASEISYGRATIETSGTWMVPDGVTSIDVLVVGGGGNGGTGDSVCPYDASGCSLGGGGGGAQVIQSTLSVSPGDNISVIVGGAGQSSSFASLNAVGGTLGQDGTGGSWGRAGNGGSGFTGELTVAGQAGNRVSYGGGNGGGRPTTSDLTGGLVAYGGGGPGGGNSVSFSPSQYGSGGYGGNHSVAAGGPGKSGIVILRWRTQ